AKNKGLSGWHSMRKDELVKALVRAAQRRAKLRAAAVSHKRVKTPKVLRRSTSIKSHAVHMRSPVVHANGSRANGVKSNGVAKHAAGSKNGKAPFGASPHLVGPRPTARQLRIAERIQRANAERERLKDLSGSVRL